MRLWTIRDAQLAALARSLADDLIEQGLARLRREHPALVQGRDPAALRALVEKARSKGAAFRFSATADVLCWVELMLRLGADFDALPQHAGARAILEDPDLSAATRLSIVLDEAKRRGRDPRGGVTP